MSKRYYLCDIIGDGSIDSPFRPTIADLGVNHTAVFPPQDPNTGQYQGSTCLVLVATANHAAVMELEGVDPFPDASLDIEWASVDRNRRNQIEAALTRRGLVKPSVDPGDGVRVFIRGVGRMLDSNFDENSFDVSE